MKALQDVFTGELPGVEPLPKKAGRKPIGARAMTDAERKRRQREKEKELGKSKP